MPNTIARKDENGQMVVERYDDNGQLLYSNRNSQQSVTTISQPSYQVHPSFQPPPSNVNVVINTNPARGMKRQWTSGLCDCCDDIGECCYAYFCPCCFLCSLCAGMNETCCSYCFGGLVPMRTQIRAERGIEGSICCDFFAVTCCPLLSVIQMAKEVKRTQPLV